MPDTSPSGCNTRHAWKNFSAVILGAITPLIVRTTCSSSMVNLPILVRFSDCIGALGCSSQCRSSPTDVTLCSNCFLRERLAQRTVQLLPIFLLALPVAIGNAKATLALLLRAQLLAVSAPPLANVVHYLCLN